MNLKPASSSNDEAPEAGPAGWFEDTLESASQLGLSFIEPAPPQSHIARVNDVRLRFLDWGNEHLPPLLFVHGFAQQAHSWDFAALAVRDICHVISLDLRGHGESNRAPTGTYIFDDLYSDLDAFISSTFASPVVICGLSLGGTLGYMYASQHSAGVKALVIAESAPESRQQGRENIREVTSGPAEFDSLDELVEAVRSLTSHRSAEQVRRSLVHSVGRNTSGKWTWKYDPAINTLHNSHPGVQTRWQALKKMTTPTLLIRGTESDITDAYTFNKMGEMIPSSQLVSIENAGHRVAGDNPSAFNAALRSFLIEQVGASPQPEGS